MEPDTTALCATTPATHPSGSSGVVNGTFKTELGMTQSSNQAEAMIEKVRVLHVVAWSRTEITLTTRPSFHPVALLSASPCVSADQGGQGGG